MSLKNTYTAYHGSENTQTLRQEIVITIIKFDLKLKEESDKGGNYDQIQQEIFAWIDLLDPRELNMVKYLTATKAGEGVISDNSLLVDIVKYSKPKYVINEDTATEPKTPAQ